MLPGRRSLRSASVLLPALLASACAPAEPLVLPVVCRALAGTDVPKAAAGPGDTLEVLVHVDSLPAGTSGAALVRVDPLDAGTVAFESPPPPTAAVVSAAFSLAGVFQGCFDAAPATLLVRTPAAPRGKAWVRIAADRPVRVQVRTGAPGPDALAVSAWAVVLPGASGRAAWRVPAAR